MQRALVATTDGSERSFRVFPSAIRLAAAARVEFRVLHVIDDTVERTAYPSDAQDRVAKRMIETRARIAEELEKLGTPAQVSMALKPQRVSLAQAILDAAVAMGALALAMDSRGQDLVRVATLGSTARRLLASSHIPILMTSSAFDATPGDGTYRVLACTDGSAAADAIGQALTGLMLDADAELAILHLDEPYDEPLPPSAAMAVDQLARWFPSHIQATQVEDPGDEGDIADRIVAAAAQEGAEVIALASHGFRLARRIGQGSVGMSVLGKSPLPMLFGH